jgi:serine/threonine protein phosphatase PrpC
MCIDNFNGDGSGLFGIFDGHGGNQVSEYSSQVIPNVDI